MILIIDNYDSFTYNLVQYVSELEEVQVHRNDEITIEEIELLRPNGIILSPGPGRPEDAGICMQVIQHFAQKTPILGVCLGHQAIAAAFGSAIVQAKEIKHGKRSLIVHTKKGLFSKSEPNFEAMRYHSLVVDRKTLPPELTVVAESNDDQEIMAIQHESLPVYGLQFHPESIGTENGKSMIEMFITICRKVNENETIFAKA